MLEDCVERSRLSPDPLPVIVAGGGSILVNRPIAGLEVIRPSHFGVANAVGAAIAQVSGEIDRVYALAEMAREKSLEDAKNRAVDAAVAGSIPMNAGRRPEAPMAPRSSVSSSTFGGEGRAIAVMRVVVAVSGHPTALTP